MSRTRVLGLEFAPACNPVDAGKTLRDGLSGVAQIGNTLWVVNDETASVERLSLADSADPRFCCVACEHRQFRLSDYLALPAPPVGGSDDIGEADLEGLAHADGYLWLVGSHSLKRKQPKEKHRPETARKRLETVSRDANRYLLARIPVVEEDGLPSLAKKHKETGRHAARLRGGAEGNALTEALQNDPHLGPFLHIPGKDNGFDIEGLAVIGKRVLLGLRGPVLRGWATILEIEPEEDAREPSLLGLASIGAGGARVRKHFVDLDGLGVRDLHAYGDDLLILAGPTMDLDGPVAVYRWRGGPSDDVEELVPGAALEHVLDLPHGDGVDHAEGITVFRRSADEAGALLVVYDAAAPERFVGECGVTADLFDWPR